MAPDLSTSAHQTDVGNLCTAGQPDELYGLRLRSLLLRRWWVLAAGLALGASLGLIFGGEAPVYEASATVYLTPASEPSGLMTAAGLNVVLSSQTNALAIVKRLGLDRPPRALNAETFLRRALTIEQVPNGYFFRVKVRLADPQLAAAAANEICERGVELMLQLWLDVLAAKPAAVQRQLEQARVALATAEDRLSHYKRPAAAPAGAPIKTSEDELGMLRDEVEIKRIVYIETGARYDRARADFAATTPPLRITDRAIPPVQPASLSRCQRVERIDSKWASLIHLGTQLQR
jgi:uncharacterized protein involved in exopolysaccharide biosynthesis